MLKYIIRQTIEVSTIHQLVQGIKIITKTKDNISVIANLTCTHSLNNIKIEMTKTISLEGLIGVLISII
jgi:hypothetical protein